MSLGREPMRLFFAVHPAPEQSAALVEQVAPLVMRLGAQPVPPQNLHATLCFIGAVDEGKLDALDAAVTSVRGCVATLCFDKLEHWENPGIVCATAMQSAASAPAHELSTRLSAAMVAAGFAPDVKPFRPHLTLGRKVTSARAESSEWPQLMRPPLLMHCDRFALMRSDRDESGSIYSAVESWPLYENLSR
jgi:RNA 2',3'-cyclic 3'-phosphodiesterase